MERLRRRLEGLRSAETGSNEAGDGTSKVTRLPRRPRRVSEAGDDPRQPWRSEGGSANDPAPTRPVMRSELQAETGWLPVDPGAGRHRAPENDPGGAEQHGSVIDLDAMRRKRAGEGAPAAGIRRVARPRRIETKPDEAHDSGRSDDRNPPEPDGPTRPH